MSVIFFSIQGDSGGPFVCNEGGRWVLRGAVSWGHSQCRTDHYTVFARVSSFIGWINSKMSGITQENKMQNFSFSVPIPIAKLYLL